MYSMYIIEDDENIRYGLKTYFDWPSMGVRVIGDAADGQHGLSDIIKMNVDIVLSDVMMPRLTGLEMAHKLREASWNGALLFLSAYGDSDKIQKALRMQADDYILKPFNDEQIIDAIGRAKQKLAQRDEHIKLQRTHRLRMLIQNGTDEARQANSRYALTLVRSGEGLADVMDIIEAHQSETFVAERISHEEIAGVWVGGFDEKALAQLCENVAASLRLHCPSAVVTTSEIVSECSALPALLTKLRAAQAQNGVVIGGGSSEAIPIERVAHSVILEMLASRREHLEPARGEEIFEMINSADVRAFGDLLDKCVALTEHLLREAGLGCLSHAAQNWHKRVNAMLLKCESCDAIRHVIIAGIQTLYVLTFNYRDSLSTFYRLRAIVETDIKDANLRLIMEKSGLSKWSLTRVIRDVCGSTVNEWVQDMRIKEACRLLRETNMRIYEVSTSVGYASVDHFTSLFHKQMDATPEQYRTAYLKGMIEHV